MPDESGNGDSSSGRLWKGLRSLIFGSESEPTLRDQIEEAIEEHEDDRPGQANGDLSPIERQMLKNLLHFGERNAGDIAVPRADIIAIVETASFAELVALFTEHGHSRVPVYRETLDQIIGMIHIKDVFVILAEGREGPADITTLMRQPRFVPETMGVLDLLAEMRTNRTHLAVVFDEYDGTEGLVTIEDLVEEIVGEIEDEHDDEPEEMIVARADGSWDVDARAELEDVAERIDPRLAEVDEDVDTIGGMAVVLAGHVPQPGESVAHDSGWRIEVTEGDERRTTRVRLHPPPEPIAVDDI
jgi:CBS domain containing-hemolysin-like protein